MTWSPMTPVAARTGSSRRDAAVSVGAIGKSVRSSPVLLVLLRPYLLEAAPAWMQADQRADAVIGFGQHAGMIRIVPGQVFLLGRTAANAAGRPVLQIRLPLPAGVSPGKVKAAPAVFDYGDDWLEITLPGWARPGDAPSPPIAAPRGPLASAAVQPIVTSTERGKQLAAEAAEIARRKAGLA